MESLDRLNLHQIEWRRANVASMGLGRWRGREYPWILPGTGDTKGLEALLCCLNRGSG